MTKLTVLMYHAIKAVDGSCAGADAHYAVSKPTYQRHLELIREAGFRPNSVAQILASPAVHDNSVAYTFDDGHDSNATAAAAVLDQGGSADLFINPTVVGQPNYLDWQALSDLAKAGISIQSHGDTHRYFDELSDTEIEHELYASKSKIEDRLGQSVVLFAPPGGRLNPRVAGIAKRLGYRGICSSRAGLWRTGDSPWRIPRLAVLSSTGDAQIKRWIYQNSREFTKMMVRDRTLAAAKRLLGNRGYEQIRLRLLGRHDDAGSTR
jgi:peptidoglycan/xylan/chitin deacetylase (PgdA/CDA1 family)